MPVPKPGSGESEQEFVSRCIGELVGEGYEQEQATAICYDTWREKGQAEAMTEGHIFIQGIISPWQDRAAEEWGEVNIKQVTRQIQDNKEAGKLIVHIHSPGGDVDEGFGIHDLLIASGKEIETRIEGLCASIATVIAMAGSVRLMTENSQFMIHNPWGDASGDSDDVRRYADQLKAIEDKVIDFYVKKTGSNREVIDKMMKQETWMTAEQAKELGFITEIITTIKAVATYKKRYNFPLINLTMNKKDFEKTIDTKFETFLSKIKGLFKGSVQAVTITTADGTILDFGEQAGVIEDIAVGMTATIVGDGVPNGDYTMPDGGVWTFDNGKLTEMKPAEEETIESLKAKVADLEKQLADATAESKVAVETIKKEFNSFRSQIKSDIKTFEPDAFKTGDGEEIHGPGKPKIGV